MAAAFFCVLVSQVSFASYAHSYEGHQMIVVNSELGLKEVVSGGMYGLDGRGEPRGEVRGHGDIGLNSCDECIQPGGWYDTQSGGGINSQTGGSGEVIFGEPGHSNTQIVGELLNNVNSPSTSVIINVGGGSGAVATGVSSTSGGVVFSGGVSGDKVVGVSDRKGEALNAESAVYGEKFDVAALMDLSF